MKILLHLGAHKTATTFIQNRLRENVELLANHDCGLVLKEHMMLHGLEEFMDWHWQLLKHPLSEFNLNHELARYLQAIASSRNKRTIISYEGLLGRMTLSGSVNIYPTVRQSAVFLQNCLRGSDVRVLFSVRNYADYIESTYRWLVAEEGFCLSFSEYLQRIDMESLSWVPVVRELANVFGRDHVGLWTYESFRGQEKTVEIEMINYGFNGDLNIALHSVAASSPANVSLAPALCVVNSFCNRFFVKIPSCIIPARRWYLNKILRYVDARYFTGRSKKMIKSDLREELTRRYEKHIRVLMHDYMFIVSPLVRSAYCSLKNTEKTPGTRRGEG